VVAEASLDPLPEVFVNDAAGKLGVVAKRLRRTVVHEASL